MNMKLLSLLIIVGLLTEHEPLEHRPETTCVLVRRSEICALRA